VSAISVPGVAVGGVELTVDQIAARTRGLVIRHVIASTTLFLVGGLLGVVLRQSQADIHKISAALWYEVMTAHGLAAFVGWAAFALMGLSFWILHEVGFHLTGWSYRLAEVAWWSMIIGVTGIVVTVLAMGFAGSWVFLYPLPFFSAGGWSHLAVGIFSASVLMVGVSILAWCGAILGVVTGPGLGARDGAGALNRFACSLGLGLLWPKRFQTARPVPYAVIPLAVIGIDMIIATLPLAVLLLEMIWQSIHPATTIDPLLAKSMLWWFGHPVVYLLLFPAVAVYYHLVPRFAKRPLVAGHQIAVAWLIGVVANVIIGAHHMYTDFPDTFQQTVNTGMQPLTYAVTVPSALSLFAIAMTIYRSEYEWSVPGTFLAVALVSWLVAGLQGVGLATIQYDVVAHNTLWVVGHFHNMALLNIGLVIFAAIYALLPALTGKQWASRRLGEWHLALTVVGGYGSVIPWMVQGLDGAPRRFAILPHQYLDMSRLAIPFVLLIVVGQALFVVNLAQTLGWRWLGDVLGPKPAPPGAREFVVRERGVDALAGLLAAIGVALALPSLVSAPFAWAPVGLLVCYTGAALGARRQGFGGMLAALVLLVVGLLT
jgi:cytochrome c oxidase subunit I